MRYMLVFLLLTGCASFRPITYALPPSKTLQQFYADSSSCEAQARTYMSLAPGDLTPFINRRNYDQCMLGKGWEHVDK